MDLLGAITKLWLTQLENSHKHKREHWGKTADRAWKYYGQSHRFIYAEQDTETDDEETRDFPQAKGIRYRATINVTAEYVKMYLPALHAKVPHRLVTPDRPMIPPEFLGAPVGTIMPPQPIQMQDKVRAWLLHWFLNYLPNKIYDLRAEGRKAVMESLVKGRGVMWHGMVDGPYGELPASYYDSTDHLFIDPDAEGLRNAAWSCRRRVRSVWKVAEEFRIDPEKLRSQYLSYRGRAESDTLGLPKDMTGADQKGDLCVYYEFYSRAGVGHKFAIADPELKPLEQALDQLGDNVFIVVCPGVDHPLNLPPEFATNPSSYLELQERLAWPIPFWARRDNPWPFTPLDYYPDLNGCWARSPLEAALPLQAFLDYAFSFLMGRVRTTCRDIIVVGKGLEKSLKEAIVSGLDQEVVEMSGKVVDDISKLLHVIQFPPVQRDLFTVLSAVQQAFERATGMTELQYGQGGPRQMRSSAEAQIRQHNQSIRPDDMAECVEAFMSKVAEAEAGAARLHVPGKAISPLFGEESNMAGMTMAGPIEQMWDQLVTTDDPNIAFSEMQYNVEAGSGRRKNKAMQIQNINDAAQSILPALIQYWQKSGDPGPLNGFFRKWGEAQDFDVEDFLLKPPPPPPPQMPMQAGGPGGGPQGPGMPPGSQGGPAPTPQPGGMPGGQIPDIPPELVQALMEASAR